MIVYFILKINLLSKLMNKNAINCPIEFVYFLSEHGQPGWHGQPVQGCWNEILNKIQNLHIILDRIWSFPIRHFYGETVL